MIFAETLWLTRSDLIRAVDCYLHVYNRGVDRQLLFFGEDYYSLFLSLMESSLIRADLKFIAYCLMPNHFHFLVKQATPFAISVFMEQVSGEYAKTVNQLRGRTGHLYQRRYGMKWIWKESDVPVAANYIHQNPPKAGLVKAPEDWEHSSCREYFGLRPPRFLELQEVLSRLNGHQSYRDFLGSLGAADSMLPSQCSFREQ